MGWKWVMIACQGFFALTGLSPGVSAAQTSAADPGIDRLKARVHQYFTAVHTRQFMQAREFILPQARSSTAAVEAGKGQVVNFSILKADLEEGGRSAIVKVKREVMSATVAGRVEMAENFRWKIDSGEWFFDPSDPPRSSASIFKEYYYEKKRARANPKPGEAPPPLEVQFEETVFDFGLAIQGEPIRHVFAFENLAAQDVMVEKIYGPEWFVKDITESRLVPAGTQGEVSVELDTSKLHLDVIQDIFVQFEPIKEIVKLRIKGKVYTAKEVAKSKKLSRLAEAQDSEGKESP